jgi:hypothetical protein
METWQIAGAIVVIIVVFAIAAYFEYLERKKTK